MLQLPTEERLRLFILVCQAIQHAHQKGIIHPDIKPSNILVTLHDGVPVANWIDENTMQLRDGPRRRTQGLRTNAADPNGDDGVELMCAVAAAVSDKDNEFCERNQARIINAELSSS